MNSSSRSDFEHTGGDLPERVLVSETTLLSESERVAKLAEAKQSAISVVLLVSKICESVETMV